MKHQSRTARAAAQPTFPRFYRSVWSQGLEDALNEVRLAERARIANILAVYAVNHRSAAAAIAAGPPPKFFVAR
jgi:hypothetical protein